LSKAQQLLQVIAWQAQRLVVMQPRHPSPRLPRAAAALPQAQQHTPLPPT
jgi:hypothetical protein